MPALDIFRALIRPGRSQQHTQQDQGGGKKLRKQSTIRKKREAETLHATVDSATHVHGKPRIEESSSLRRRGSTHHVDHGQEVRKPRQTSQMDGGPIITLVTSSSRPKTISVDPLPRRREKFTTPPTVLIPSFLAVARHSRGNTMKINTPALAPMCTHKKVSTTSTTNLKARPLRGRRITDITTTGKTTQAMIR